MKNNQAGMTLIVKTVTRLTVGLILIYGIYIVLAGHVSPGGGFAGGVIVALSFIHLMLAFGKQAVLKKLNETRGLNLASGAMILFLALVTLGFTGGQSIFKSNNESFRLFGSGLIPFYEIALAVVTGTALFVIFLALVLLNGERKEK